ncbi:MAG: hypothetical protein AABZ39_14975 [Spirochaetota bacterium]|mgnify:CR=1 FL=1
MKRTVLIIGAAVCAALLSISCASTSASAIDGSFSVKKVDSWSNPTFKGGKTKRVTSEGVGDVGRRGVAAARDEAIQDAQRKAVMEVVGSYVTSEANVQNNELISKNITDKSSGYVANYKIESEKNDSGLYTVTINAEVGMDMIHDNLQALGLLIDKANLPLIAVILKERGIDKNKNDFEVTGMNIALEAALSARGFKIVDRDMLKSVLAKENIRFTELGGAAMAGAISKIGVGTGAQVVIVGEALGTFFKMIEGTEMKSYRIAISLKAVNVADGTVIPGTQISEQGGHMGGSDEDVVQGGFKRVAGEKVNDKLISAISKSWQEIAQSGTEYTLLVSGLKFKDQLTLEEELPKSFRNVKKVFNKGMLGDAAKFLVRYLGSARDLAADLEREGEKTGFVLEVQNMDDKTITVKAKKAAK